MSSMSAYDDCCSDNLDLYSNSADTYTCVITYPGDVTAHAHVNRFH